MSKKGLLIRESLFLYLTHKIAEAADVGCFAGEFFAACTKLFFETVTTIVRQTFGKTSLNHNIAGSVIQKPLNKLSLNKKKETG